MTGCFMNGMSKQKVINTIKKLNSRIVPAIEGYLNEIVDYITENNYKLFIRRVFKSIDEVKEWQNRGSVVLEEYPDIAAEIYSRLDYEKIYNELVEEFAPDEYEERCYFSGKYGAIPINYRASLLPIRNYFSIKGKFSEIFDFSSTRLMVFYVYSSYPVIVENYFVRYIKGKSLAKSLAKDFFNLAKHLCSEINHGEYSNYDVEFWMRIRYFVSVSDKTPDIISPTISFTFEAEKWLNGHRESRVVTSNSILELDTDNLRENSPAFRRLENIIKSHSTIDILSSIT